MPLVVAVCFPLLLWSLEWFEGKSEDEALKIDNMGILEELFPPPVKIHCSVLGEDLIKAAINDYW